MVIAMCRLIDRKRSLQQASRLINLAQISQDTGKMMQAGGH
jgi:hypothetical protein